MFPKSYLKTSKTKSNIQHTKSNLVNEICYI